jgi:hypothetical protein
MKESLLAVGAVLLFVACIGAFAAFVTAPIWMGPQVFTGFVGVIVLLTGLGFTYEMVLGQLEERNALGSLIIAPLCLFMGGGMLYLSITH